MEFLLQWADDLDDALGALRHLLPRILALVAAAGLFAVTGFALLFAPTLTLTVIALTLSASLAEVVRRRRASLLAQRLPTHHR